MVMRKSKTGASAGETSLARTSPSPFAWFEDVDRWFDSLRRDFEDRFWGRSLGRVEGSDLAIREPLVDVIDQGSEFVVRAELPGVSKEDIDLKVTSDGIEIRAKADRSREEKEKDYYFRERTYQAYERALSFPEEVKADLASAALKDGVLEVRIPKKQPTPESKPVKVPVE
jgi:HSP20 family protein